MHSADERSNKPSPPAPSLVKRFRSLVDMTTPWVMRVTATLGIADLISAGVDRHDTLAERTGTDPAALSALLAYLVEIEVLTASPDGTFALGELGAPLLATPPGKSGWKERLDLSGAGAKLDGALAALHRSLTSGEAGYPAVYGLSLWEDVEADRDFGEKFDRQLAARAMRWAPEVAALDLWAHHHRVVDVAGGAGITASRLAANHEHLEVTLVELPAAAARAHDYVSSRPGAERIRIHEGSFFDPLPPDRDLYLLAQVLHDWNNHDALRILRRCTEAMAPGGELLIIERLPDESGRGLEHAQMSILMLVLFGAKERSLPQYRELVEAAELSVVDVTPLGSGLSVLRCRQRTADGGGQPRNPFGIDRTDLRGEQR